jgi:hypothetical protein
VLPRQRGKEAKGPRDNAAVKPPSVFNAAAQARPLDLQKDNDGSSVPIRIGLG